MSAPPIGTLFLTIYMIASFLWSKRTAAFFFRCRAAVSVFLFAWTLISRDADFTSHKQIAHHKIKKLCLYMANAEISVTSKNIVKGEREIFFLLLKRTFHILQTELKLYRYSIAPRMMVCYTVGICQYTRWTIVRLWNEILFLYLKNQNTDRIGLSVQCDLNHPDSMSHHVCHVLLLDRCLRWDPDSRRCEPAGFDYVHHDFCCHMKFADHWSAKPDCQKRPDRQCGP